MFPSPVRSRRSLIPLPPMRRTLPVLLFALSLALGGCHSWYPQSSPVPDVVASRNGRGLVRVLRHDGGVTVLANARVVGDSIVGTAGNPPRHQAVALANVERIETRRTDAMETGVLVFGGLAFATTFAALAAVARGVGGCE